MKVPSPRLTRTFLVLTVGTLAVFGRLSFLQIPENPGQRVLYAFYGLAMFVDAAILLLCAWLLGKRTKFAFALSVTVLALNIVLTIFDQVGWVDVLFMLLNLVTLVFLILARKEFLPA